MASNSYFFPPNQQDPLQLSLKSPSTQLTFSTAPCISSHFCFSFLQKSCFSSQLTSTACSLSQKCLLSQFYSLPLSYRFFFSLPKTLCSCFPSKPPPIPLLTLYSLLTLFSYKNFFFPAPSYSTAPRSTKKVSISTITMARW